MMDTLIEQFPSQIKEAIDIASRTTFNDHQQSINKVVLIGMGGSGIGGDIVKNFILNEAKVPFLVSKSYSAPAYIDKNTLVIVSSYSGQTEETLSALSQIENTGAKIVCISSGGEVLKTAKDKNYDFVALPDNYSSPRACLGYSVVSQLILLNKLNLINDSIVKNLKTSVDLIKFNIEDIQLEAQKIAKRLFSTIPIIYTTDQFESVAVRFRQQLNENSKMLAWHNVIPEMNHNELVGWRSKKNVSVIYFRSKNELERNAIRIKINQNIISEYCDNVLNVYAKGQSLVEQSMYLIHLGDWISFYLAIMNKMDSIEVNVIDHLKSELAKVKS